VTWNDDVNEFTYEKKDDAKSITMAVTGTLLFVPFIGLILFQLLLAPPGACACSPSPLAKKGRERREEAGMEGGGRGRIRRLTHVLTVDVHNLRRIRVRSCFYGRQQTTHKTH